MLFPVIVITSGVIAWSLLVGWVLTLLLPFELFEGTVIGMLASFMAARIMSSMVGSLIPLAESDEESDDDTE
jgi:hypothetical protein